MDTDYATLRWTPRDVMPGVRVGDHVVPGLQTGQVTIESRVGFRCEMKTAGTVALGHRALSAPQIFRHEA